MHPVSSAENYHFNHEYGFGVVDAQGAVDLAKAMDKYACHSASDCVFG